MNEVREGAAFSRVEKKVNMLRCGEASLKQPALPFRVLIERGT